MAAAAAKHETTPLSPRSAGLYFVPRNRTFNEEDEAEPHPGVQMTPVHEQKSPEGTVTPARAAGGAQRWNFWRWATGRGDYEPVPEDGDRAHSQLPRKVPVRVEPKVFFANERTYLAWLHMAMMLASISVAIVALAEKEGASGTSAKIYGVVLMPVAIAFCCYALHMYLRRNAMLRRKDPGPFDDRVGPTVLGLMLLGAIITSFSIKVYATYA
uniref:DUF202 domain-containing protein n=1 Tax=Rhizochromulina marina TaxID=1034831 RepID=A0A7S2RWM5_9STRA|mmetsp:Transcript_22059/g.64049  ORF Transcript_22059/g.64049 Transcript_22059/m.64049 type:complete len:213 (+) Transcript_22059:43-681(+)